MRRGCINMRRFFALAALLSLAFLAGQQAAPADEKTVLDLDEVTKRISKHNFLVKEQAIKVYQAREAIQVARGNLLPSLNVWAIGQAVIDWRMALTLGDYFLPFLIPANWSRVEEQKWIYEAAKDSYQALWANEVLAARLVYGQVLSDQKFSIQLQQELADLDRLLKWVENQERFGRVEPGSSLELQVRKQALGEDSKRLGILIQLNLAQLAYLLGIPQGKEVSLKSESLMSGAPVSLEHLDELIFKAKQECVEAQQFEKLSFAAKAARRGFTVSALGVNTLSRSQSGTALDQLPVQSGWGFGSTATLRITDAQAEMLLKLKDYSLEQVGLQVKTAMSAYDLETRNVSVLQARLRLTEEQVQVWLKQAQLGGEVGSILELIEASRNRLAARKDLISAEFRIFELEERLMRALRQGVYYGTLQAPPFKLKP